MLDTDVSGLLTNPICLLWDEDSSSKILVIHDHN